MGQFSRQIQWNVTRSVAVASLFYLIYHGAKACLFPFITLYYRELGLTATQTGIICGSKALIWYFAAPIWMVMAKRIQKTRIILCFALLAAIACNLSITLIPTSNPNAFKECITAAPTDGTQTIDFPVSVLAGNTTIATTLSTTTNPISDTTSKQATVTSSTTSSPMKSTSPSQKSTETTTQMTTYKLAVLLTPRVAKDLLTFEGNIVDLLQTYNETKNLPSWKQKIIAQKLQVLLEVDKPEKENVATTISTTTTTIKFTTTHSASSTQTTASLMDTVRLLAQELKTVYLQQRVENPSLTPKKFIETYGKTYSLSAAAKKVLATALKDEILKDSIQKRSILDNSIDGSLENGTNVVNGSIGTNSSITTTVIFIKDSIVNKVTENVSTFLWILLIVATGELMASPIELLTDSSLYELLDELDSLNRYGKHRTWAMLGTLICGISVSLLVYFSPCLINGNMSRFHIHFYAFASLAGLAFAMAPFFPSYTARSAHAQMRKISCIMCPTCSSVTCTDCRHTLLIITVFIVGISQAAVQEFLFWEVQDMPGSSEIIYGAFVSAGALSSMLAAIFGRRLLTAIKPFIVGPVTLFFVAAQLFLFSILFTPWMIIPLQLLNILGHSLLWALVSYQTNMTMSASWNEDSGSIRRVNDIHVFARASQQRALYTAYICTYQGVAFAIGSIVSGIWYDLAGGSLIPVLRGFALIIVVWACLYMFYQCCCLPRRLHNKYSKLVADSDEDEDEIFDASTGKNSSWYTRTKTNGQYRNNNRQKGNSGLRIKKQKSKRYKSFKHEYSPTSSEDETEDRDWLAVAMKKEDSRML
uniref:Major facilitator superfamily domain-containing protein 6-like protein A n=1 Tax=Phallusia mammillata TaxID=59560 RepID=A0A6F9DLD4_9ASCI|nr:major facilitator superfamily domain-containing protein 6-like protein A [Phallusia mammillata]